MTPLDLVICSFTIQLQITNLTFLKRDKKERTVIYCWYQIYRNPFFSVLDSWLFTSLKYHKTCDCYKNYEKCIVMSALVAVLPMSSRCFPQRKVESWCSFGIWLSLAIGSPQCRRWSTRWTRLRIMRAESRQRQPHPTLTSLYHQLPISCEVAIKGDEWGWWMFWCCSRLLYYVINNRSRWHCLANCWGKSKSASV